jgi:hypothetical protein
MLPLLSNSDQLPDLSVFDLQVSVFGGLDFALEIRLISTDQANKSRDARERIRNGNSCFLVGPAISMRVGRLSVSSPSNAVPKSGLEDT